jgi:shikimate O-hydroxycinnamoyltransferase
LPIAITITKFKTKHQAYKKMVTITSSHTVIPEEPTPQGRLWLSDIDQVVRLRHTPTLYIYKPKQNQEHRTMVETLTLSDSFALLTF